MNQAGNQDVESLNNRSSSNALQLCTTSGFSSDLKLVFESDFTVNDIKAMCDYSSTFIRLQDGYNKTCIKYETTERQSCCPDISIGNVIASISNRPSCMNVTESDVTAMKARLLQCAPWYANRTLISNCAEIQKQKQDGAMRSPCLQVPQVCTENNAVYIILHYLTDVEFVESLAQVCVSSVSKSCGRDSLDWFPPLRYGLLLLQGYTRDSDRRWLVKLYHNHLASTEHHMGVTVAGSDLYIDVLIFHERLISETMFPSISIVFIFVIMWVYTGSLFVTSMACLAIVSSIVITYFLYMVVFRDLAFGFLNMLALIIVIGVGADDVFVYLDVWKQTKKAMPTATMTEWVNITLRHAALSMFVTSFTTAIAFLANIISPITGIKTFGIFTAIAILSNYALMITWLPAIVVVYERHLSSLCCRVSTPRDEDKRFSIRRLPDITRSAFNVFFTRYLAVIVVKLRYLFVVLLGLLAIGMSIVVFYKPQLNLPSSARFQFFVKSDPLSSYILNLQDHFYFEKVDDSSDSTLPLYLWWGIQPEDAGNPFNADDKPLKLDYKWPTPFEITEEIQQWFMDFCEAIEQEGFYRATVTCFVTEFFHWQQGLRESVSCDDEKGIMRTCCEVVLPTNWSTLASCLQLIPQNSSDSDHYSIKFDRAGNVRAVTAMIISDQTFSRSYEAMKSFWSEVEDFMIKWGQTAPDGLGRGWFSGAFEFMDLQGSLFDGTLVAMGVSLACSFVILFLTTLNVVISIYAIISIGGVLVSTVGTLVLIGWELGIFESVTIAIAVGLSVDFTVHFGVAYRLCRDQLRQQRVTYAITHIGPAVTMAAITTVIAGLMMMPATILTYFQLGLFLILVMTYSWIFANFCFLPMCAIMGPQYKFAQVSLPANLDCYGESARSPNDVSGEQTKNNSNQNISTESDGKTNVILVRVTSV